MCYHTSIKRSNLQELINLKKKILKGDFPDLYHVSGFTRPFLPVTLNTEPEIIQPAQWKLIPSWVKSNDGANRYANTLNAESETIFAKPSYRPYIIRRHGLLWVDGFYEPHKATGKNETENYYIYRPDHKAFALGIVWAPWTDQDTGELINTFSVITTPANKLLSEIHNEKKRMPLIIKEEDHGDWLYANTKDDIQYFFKPAPDDYLQAHKIAARVTSGKQDFNIPEVQDPAKEHSDTKPGLLF